MSQYLSRAKGRAKGDGIFKAGRKSKEIAEQLDISEQTVETHMKRALKTLRLRLGLVLYLVVYLDLWHLKK